MARVAATIALVGRRPVPTFALVGRRPLFPRVIPVSVARTVRALMHDVVSFGTGIAAQIPGVVVAGKTGTAEVVTPPPCTATGASGTTGTGGPATRAATGGPAARPASGGAALAHAAQAGTGGVAAPPAGTGPTGAASSSGGGAGAPSGQGATAGAGTGGASSGSAGGGGTAPASGSGTGTGAPGGAPAGSTAPAALTGPTGPTNCAGVDNNPYDTDAWFVAFAPEINPRFVVAVLLPHDGAGGTTAAPLAKVILEQALASGS
jgi:cell division protein FtsI/penicillin-binding protein 2